MSSIAYQQRTPLRRPIGLAVPSGSVASFGRFPATTVVQTRPAQVRSAQVRSTQARLAQPRLAQAPLRLTRRGRMVLGLLIALVVAAVAIAAFALQAPAASAGQNAAEPLATVSVMPGDTLWSIAEALAPADDPRDVIIELKRLNQLSSVSLKAGQVLMVPARYSS